MNDEDEQILKPLWNVKQHPDHHPNQNGQDIYLNLNGM